MPSPMPSGTVPATPRTSTGLPENVASALCYLLGVLTGIIFLLVEKENRTVRFHAMQSTAAFGAIVVVQIVSGMIPILGWLFGALLVPVALVLWIVMLISTLQGKRIKLPIAGEFAEQHTGA